MGRTHLSSLLPASITSRNARHVLEYAGFRIVFGLFRLLPLDAATRILAMACRIYSSRSRRHRRALANLEMALPEKSLAEREAIAQSMWENVGRVIAESVHFDRFLAEPHRLDLLDMRALDTYAPGNGLFIVASMHTGNWEIGLLHSARRGFNPAALYRVVANPYVDRFIKRTRSQIYSGGLFAVRDERGGRASADTTSRQLVECLRRGLPLGILADHYDDNGVLVPFFGKDVRVSRVPATLAYQFKARICVARTIRLGRQSRFLGEAIELEMPRTGDRHADIQAVTIAIQRQFEAWIREYPEQWLWSQAPLVRSSDIDHNRRAHHADPRLALGRE
jgi:Kdo2-lipid IVA lauroyltransferase/acyltransferase